MPRTPEQVAADEQLTAAVEALRKAYPDPADIGQEVLTEWVLLIRLRSWDADGDAITTNAFFCRDNSVSNDLVMGMLGDALEVCKYRAVQAYRGNPDS